MKSFVFKTDIRCSGCVAAVTPYLDRAAGAKNWIVDIDNPQKLLTVTSEGEVSPGDVIDAMSRAGYRAELVDERPIKG